MAGALCDVLEFEVISTKDKRKGRYKITSKHNTAKRMTCITKHNTTEKAIFTAFGLSSKRSRAGETVPEPTESPAVAGSSSSQDRSSESSPVESQSGTVESSTARTVQSDKTSVPMVKWW